MGAFQSTNNTTPSTQTCVGAGCCTWNGLNSSGLMPLDGCITELRFRTDNRGGIWGFNGVRISTIRDVIGGKNGVLYYPWHTAIGVNMLTQSENKDGKNYDQNSESNTNNVAFRVGGASSITTPVVPPSAGYALSGIMFRVAQANFNIYGMIPLEVRWMNLSTFEQTDWTPVVAGQVPINDPGLCEAGGTVQYAGGTNDKKLIQKFNVNWGPGNGDGIFSMFNVTTFDLGALYAYALATPTPLLKSTPGEKYPMYLGSDFDKIQDSFYRNLLVDYWCKQSKAKDPKGIMDPVCWCRYPAEAVLDPRNNIYIDRKIADSKTQQGYYSGAPPKCYLTDCKVASSGCERLPDQPYTPCSQPGGTYLFTNPDVTNTCPALPPINICAVNIDIWESKDVEVVISELQQKCNFTTNNPPPECLKPENKNNPICKAFLPPGPAVDCKDPKNRNTPQCIAYCNDPANRNKPECTPVPGPVVDCTNPANRNTPQCIAYCNDPANRNKPECKTPPTPPVPIDCTDPANRNKPECQPKPTPEIDCTLDVNKSLAVCFCKISGNRTNATCIEYCGLEENKNKPECTPPTFWDKYKGWIIAFVVFIIVLVIVIAIYKMKGKTSQPRASG